MCSTLRLPACRRRPEKGTSFPFARQQWPRLLLALACPLALLHFASFGAWQRKARPHKSRVVPRLARRVHLCNVWKTRLLPAGRALSSHGRVVCSLGPLAAHRLLPLFIPLTSRHRKSQWRSRSTQSSLHSTASSTGPSGVRPKARGNGPAPLRRMRSCRRSECSHDAYRVPLLYSMATRCLRVTRDRARRAAWC